MLKIIGNQIDATSLSCCTSNQNNKEKGNEAKKYFSSFSYVVFTILFSSEKMCHDIFSPSISILSVVIL